MYPFTTTMHKDNRHIVRHEKELFGANKKRRMREKKNSPSLRLGETLSERSRTADLQVTINDYCIRVSDEFNL